MLIPANAVIPDEKITRYLLVPKPKDDKSKFLAQAELTQENPETLKAAIRLLAGCVEAVEDRSNEYGVFYRVEGELIGINGLTLSVVTIWLQRAIDGSFQFITLMPKKEYKSEL